MTMARIRVYAILVVAALTPGTYADAQTIDSTLIGGWVLIYGATEGKEHQVGIAEIAPGGEGLIVDWQVEGRRARGVGFYRDSILWVARGWGNDPGTCMYEISGHAISGIWSLIGSDGLTGTESWSGGNVDASSARFAIAGVNPDGSRYEGEVLTRREGNVYDVKWIVGDNTFYGIGIRSGARLVVAWCSEGSVDVARFSPDGDGWRGISATLGQSSTRDERLLRPSTAPPRETPNNTRR